MKRWRRDRFPEILNSVTSLKGSIKLLSTNRTMHKVWKRWVSAQNRPRSDRYPRRIQEKKAGELMLPKMVVVKREYAE